MIDEAKLESESNVTMTNNFTCAVYFTFGNGFKTVRYRSQSAASLFMNNLNFLSFDGKRKDLTFKWNSHSEDLRSFCCQKGTEQLIKPLNLLSSM